MLRAFSRVIDDAVLLRCWRWQRAICHFILLMPDADVTVIFAAYTMLLFVAALPPYAATTFITRIENGALMRQRFTIISDEGEQMFRFYAYVVSRHYASAVATSCRHI